MPDNDGLRNATVSISNSDPVKDPYVFSVSGTGRALFPFTDDFSTDKGWTGLDTGGWERGFATAGGGENGNPDPALDHSHTDDNYILGFAPGEDYPNDLIEKAVISPPIDCSEQDQVFLKFWRYLNVGSSERAGIYVSGDGATWTLIWENRDEGTGELTEITDSEWTSVVYDISSLAVGEESVYIKFIMGPTDSSQRFSGWNIDDLEVTSGYSISGFIRDRSGEPAGGVQVCFKNGSGTELKPCVETDAYGFYIQYGFDPYRRTAKNTVYVIPHDHRFKFFPGRELLRIKDRDIRKDFKAKPVTP